MAQVRTLDTTLLDAAPDQHPGLATGAVAILDGGIPDYETLKSLLQESIQLLPRCT